MIKAVKNEILCTQPETCALANIVFVANVGTVGFMFATFWFISNFQVLFSFLNISFVCFLGKTAHKRKKTTEFYCHFLCVMYCEPFIQIIVNFTTTEVIIYVRPLFFYSRVERSLFMLIYFC